MQSIPLGTLGTGAVEVCSDGRFRNLSINNNRTLENRIPLVPHSFLAVRVSDGANVYVRRLQTAAPPFDDPHLLPAGTMDFRGRFPQVDCRISDPAAPTEIVWSAFAPIVPYDYEASVLPLAFFAIQVKNTGPKPLDISALLNWQNTVGQHARDLSEPLRAISRTTLVSEGEWERASNGPGKDNERRLSASTGQIAAGRKRSLPPEEVLPNALVFGDARAIDTNADGQYCVATAWHEDYRTSLAVWDPEDHAGAGAFWEQFTQGGSLGDGVVNSAVPRCGAVCNTFRLAPGESRSVEFVVSWYCPRYAGADTDAGNFYANRFPDATSVARTGLKHGAYYHAAIRAWQQRLNASDLPAPLVKQLFSSCEVLSTNSIYTRDGEFGLLESLHDPRLNYLRDRWFWSMGLLLFFPRLELEVLERMSLHMVDEETRKLRISDGLEGFSEGEYVGPGAAQVEACVHLVAMTYRNYRFGGNLSSIKRIMPRLQSVMAIILAQDKDFDGFPDIYHEKPGLDCAFANGFNVVTAGLWMVALRAYERLARGQQFPEADVYKKAFDRASRSFDRYFWDRDEGYYTLYPNPAIGDTDVHGLDRACHMGQLTAIWMAQLLDLGDVFPPARVARVLETLETHHVGADRHRAITFPGESGVVPAAGFPPEDEASKTYDLVRYACTRLHYSPDAPVLTEIKSLIQHGVTGPARHVGQLALWYFVVASPSAQLDLSTRCLTLRPDLRHVGAARSYTLYTPNGFGSVSMHVGCKSPFECAIEFKMDIPQELTRIAVYMPAGADDVHCTLETEDGPVVFKASVELTDGTPQLTIAPGTKLSASDFFLRILEKSTRSAGTSARKQWKLPWFRR